ncbi:MAG: FadR family transcriptional regulator [Oligoflexia bacterium]|nr:FadR family transcriptional regulator [Oligoflexia bacterium]
MALGPVKRRSVAGDVYDQLSNEILTGVYKPGQALPAERALSELLTVNRGAVREAISRLAAAGFVESRQGAGTIVLDYRRHGGLGLLSRLIVHSGGIDPKAMRALAELRSCIGVDAARLAATRHSADDRDHLELASQAIAQASDRAGRQRAALKLWSTVVDASDNIAYRLAMNGLVAAYQPVQPLLLSVLGDEFDDVAGHQQVVRAILSRSASDAAETARTLLGKGGDSLVALAEISARRA